MSERPRLTVVIPTHQRCGSVRRTLQALARQTLSPDDYEVLVCIDGSLDGTGEMVESLRAPFALRARWQRKAGRAAACNAGIREARGGLIVLLDDDMEPAPGFLSAHLRAHAEASRVGVVGAAPVFVEGESSPVVAYMASRFHSHLEKLSRPDHVIGVRDVYTGNFSLPRALFLEVGLFDETFATYGNEDGELAIRLLAAGVRLVFSSEAFALQHYEKDFEQLARDKVAQGRTSVACAWRHPEETPNLRIGTYRRGPRKWRVARRLLVALSGPARFLPGLVLDYVRWLEKRQSPRLQSRYDLALDYFYWLGVRTALRENPETGGRIRL